MKIAKTFFVLISYLLVNYFIAFEVFDIESLSVIGTLLVTLLTSIGSAFCIVIITAMFALIYNILGEF